MAPGSGKELRPEQNAHHHEPLPGVQVAVITRRPQGYFITHVEGDGTPLVNGTSIGSAEHALQPADVIELSGTRMEFWLH